MKRFVLTSCTLLLILALGLSSSAPVYSLEVANSSTDVSDLTVSEAETKVTSDSTLSSSSTVPDNTSLEVPDFSSSSTLSELPEVSPTDPSVEGGQSDVATGTPIIDSSSSSIDSVTSSSTIPSSSSSKPSSNTASSSSSTTSSSKQTKTETRSATASVELSSLYRLYHPSLRVHLYTRDTNEYKVLGGRGWIQEGVAWQTATKQGEIVYRLYHPGLRVHLYTRDINEYRVLGSRGWQQEGESYRSYGNIPIYRLYHPDLQRHLYTRDMNEYRVLGSRGWKQEGIAFYGVGSGSVTPPPSPQLPVVSGNFSIQTNQNGSFEVKIQNVQPSNQVSAVKVAVWTELWGQDDLVWYTATRQSNGSYQLTVKASEHLHQYGNYHVHVYYLLKNQQMVGAKQMKALLPEGEASAKLSIGSLNTQELTFDARVSDLVAPGGLQSVVVAVWSEVGGQDDLRWYEAMRQSDGSYKIQVRLSDHKYNFGRYQIHAYLVLKSQKMVGVGRAGETFIQPSQAVNIKSSYLGTGNYRLQFNHVLTANQLRFAVWSEANGQDDLRWYEASRKDVATFVGQFNAQNHSRTGKYQVHLYAVVNGQMQGLTSTTIQVPKADFSAPYYSQRDGRWGGRFYGAWNFDATGCVPAVLSMIISGIKGQNVQPVPVGDYLYYHTLEFNHYYAGTSSRGIVLAAKNWGLKTSVLNSPTELTRALQDGYYVAAAVGPSRFIISGGHELVLKGYQNGNTYVMDPYNPQNNGWYSIDYLWNIQSRDPIDLTEGRPFLKVTD